MLSSQKWQKQFHGNWTTVWWKPHRRT